LGLPTNWFELAEVDTSILGLIAVEGVLHLEDLVLVEALIQVFLDWKIAGDGRVGAGL
jgi:hypothetical protein